MKTLSYLFTLFLAFILFSCENENYEIVNDNSNTSVNSFTFTFEGKVYSSIAYNIDDSTMVLEDKNVDEIYSSLMKLPELATYIDDNGDLYFFKNEEELDNYLRPKTKVSFPSYPLPILRVHFYSGENYTGTKAPFSYGSGFLVPNDRMKYYLDRYYTNAYRLEVPDLRIWDFNDILTSFSISDVSEKPNASGVGQYNIRLYEHVGFKGNTVTFTGRDIKIASLAPYASIKNRVSAFRIYSRDY
jgi:hypothetical protein